MDRKQLVKDQEAALKHLDAVRAELLKLPNVVAVGLGYKETAGEFTKQLCYRVYVSKKVDADALGAGLIPKTIAGLPTDVLKPLRFKDDSEVCGTDRNEEAKHRPLRAGIQISRSSSGGGTLGWFGKLGDGTLVMISNKHVLYGSGDGEPTDARKIGQPLLGKVSKCCCCECGSDNVAGETIVGIRNVSPLTASSVDVALAKVSSLLAAEVLFEITNESSEEVLTVSGKAVAVVGERVRKVGQRSGFTRGTVIHIGDMAGPATDPEGTDIDVLAGQVLIIPTDDETYEIKNDATDECMRAFSNSGDSGSVILNDDDMIVALNRAGNREDYAIAVTIACNIETVLTALANKGFAITLSKTSDGGERRYAKTRSHQQPRNSDPAWFERARDLNRGSVLYELVLRHQSEVLELINERRAVTVAWQRNKGPAFVAALARSGRVARYQIPFDIEGVTREQLLLAMERTLHKHGSAGLKRDLQLYREQVLNIATRGRSVAQLAQQLLEQGLITAVPDEVQPAKKVS